MYETTDELLKQIRLGEDSSLELRGLRFKVWYFPSAGPSKSKDEAI
jgi:hypothetical protein